MRNLLILLLGLSLGYINNSRAEEVSISADNAITPEVVEEVAIENSEQLNNISENSEKKPEVEILHHIEHQQVPLPQCDDKKLEEAANDFITAYLDKSTIMLRRRYFILHNLDKFAEEKVANYKTSSTRPVSDVIASIKVNKGIAEENIRLCKNQSKDKFAGKLYLIIFPQEEAFAVNIVNLIDSNKDQSETYFVYTN